MQRVTVRRKRTLPLPAAMRGSIGTKIDLGIALALGPFLAICVVAFESTQRLLDTVHQQLSTHRFLAELDDLCLSLQDAETGQRGYLLTGDENSASRPRWHPPAGIARRRLPCSA